MTTPRIINKHLCRHPYAALFLMGVLLYLMTVLPFFIYHGGIFFYYGDYNVQQVPFYVLGNRIVKSGHLFWTPSIDLGTSWLGSFAMYLSGSPFFYLSVLFPETIVPYLMPFFMSLKFGTALTAAYAYAETLIPSKAKPAQPADSPRALTTWNQGALIAALLYTFSGWSQTNIVFQHFHEAYAFFPLYLLLFDRYLTLSRFRDKRAAAICDPEAQSYTSGMTACTIAVHADIARTGIARKANRAGLVFSLMTAFTAILNYYFFYGEALFLILYYVMRYVIGVGRSMGQILREILGLLARGILGVCLAAFFLVQVYDMLSGNTRLTDTISGLDMVIYKGRSTPLAIIKSLFYLPDLIGRGTLFTNEEIKNSMPGLYLPLFAASGVIAYYLARRLREDWLKRLLTVCAVIAMIPVLNSAYNMFNAEYYSRWYFMPILFMAIATARMLTENALLHLRHGAWINIAAFLLIALCVFLPSYDEEGNLVFGRMVAYENIYMIQLLITAILTAVLLLVVCILPARALRRQAASTDAYPLLTPRLVLLVMAACVISTIGTLFAGNTIIARTGGVKWRQQLLDNRPEIPASVNANAARQTANKSAMQNPDPDSNENAIQNSGQDSNQNDAPQETAVATAMNADDCWYRIETDGSSTNYELVWNMPTIHSFQSTIPGGLFDFYHGIGYNRTVNTKLSFLRVGARALTSVRYHLENAIVSTDNNYTESGGMPGYTFIGESDNYNIYEQQHFIPMGFTFDSYITEDHYALIESASDKAADRLLVRDLILSKEDAAAYGHLFDREDTDLHLEPESNTEFLSDCDDRAATACTYFAYTDSGFEAISDNQDEELVFFSIPYDNGFTATIDGSETTIIRADYGLMAIDVPAGEHEIAFRFRPAYLTQGSIVSAIAAGIIILLFILY